MPLHKELEVIQSSLLSSFPIQHACFTRKGGVSKPPYHSLNLSHDVEDIYEDVEENLNRISTFFDGKTIHYAKQVHGTTIREVTPKSPMTLEACDALITNYPGIPIMVRHADCQAAIFYDTKQKAIAVVHAGWQGNVQNIYAATLRALSIRYKTQAKDLFVWVSPSLGPKHSEFCNYQQEFPSDFWNFKDKDHYINLWAVARWQLESLKIPKEQIEIAQLCTFEDKYRFFSFRRESTTGRNGTAVCITE